MLFHALREQDPTTYVEQIVVTLSEPLDVPRLVDAWHRLVQQHPMLRTRFRWKGLAQPVQEVIDGARLPVEQFERADGLERLIEEQRARGFDLEQAPLMRLALVRGAGAEHTMVWTLHHMLLDGHGRALLLQELFDLYQGAELAQRRPYRDYIEWLRGLDKERARDFWQRALAGFRAPTPLGVARELPGTGYGVHEYRLPAALTGALRKRARASRVTLNVLLQGAWALLLHRYSGEDDVVFGVTRAGRASALEGAAGIVGPLINTVPLRVRIDPEAEVGAWLEAQREPQLALRDYEHTPLVDVQRWSEVPRGTPLFESLFVFAQHTLEAQLRALGGAWSTRGFRNVGNTHYPLALAAYGDDELLLELQYSRRHFADDVVQRMAGHLQTLLEGMAASPRAKLRELPLLTADERHQVVKEWNATAVAYPPARCAHELVEEQARLRPEALAAEDGGRSITYRELDERAERLASRLRLHGVKPDSLVAVYLERSIEMLVALLAVWKAGAAYVPIDREYPAERVRFMLEDTAAPVVLTQKRLAGALPASPAKVVQVDLEAVKGERDRTRSPPSPDRLAYVIYTSGSTGVPKGVPITHRSLFNLICWHREAYAVTPADRATQIAGPAFDAAVWEIWPYLAAGASVHIPDERTRLDARLLVRWLAARGITLAFLPTPLAEAALREPWPESSRAARAAHRRRQARCAAGADAAVPPRQPLRADREHRGEHVCRSALARRAADRATAAQHRGLRRRPPPAAGADRGAGRAPGRRRAIEPGLLEAAGPHGRAVHSASFRQAALPDRRSRAPACRRQPRIPRAHRRPGEDPRVSRRARRDRSGARAASRGARGGGGGARQRRGRQAPRRLFGNPE